MPESSRSIFSGLQIFDKQRWLQDEAVVVEDGKIKAVIPVNMMSHHLPAKHYSFQPDHYLVPGFIDLHIHGARGHDVMDASGEALVAISHALAEEGVTGFLATTLTAKQERIEKALQAIAENESNEALGAAILGAHLEGPFISKAKKGAQPDEVRKPDLPLVKHWQAVSNHAIKLLTLAPELPGGIEFIQSLHDMDVVVSVGHTNATVEETNAAIAAGATHATHLFNAMTGWHAREPGAVTALLLAKNVVAELIVDGIHLHPATVTLALEIKHKDHLVLITDAMRAKCLGDGTYDLGGQTVGVRQGKATLSDGTLAGSTLTMSRAIKNMVSFTHCSLIDAISMASFNPARVLGLEQSKGSIETGKDADLVVLDADLKVVLTMRGGKKIF